MSAIVTKVDKKLKIPDDFFSVISTKSEVFVQKQTSDIENESWSGGSDQGMLAEREGSVQLISLLRYLVL